MQKTNALINIPKSSKNLPAKQLKELSPASYVDVFKCESKSLATIRKEDGEKLSKIYITLMLADIESFYGDSVEGLSKVQAQMLVEMILKQYYYLKISDLKLFAEKFKLGLYGKVYNRIDGGTIMDALKKYIDQRLEEGAAYTRLKESQKHKKRGDFAALNVLEAIATKWKDVTPEKKAKPVFQSIRQYCKYYGLDEKETADAVAFEIELSYNQSGVDMSHEDYKLYYMAQWLFDKTVEARKR